MRLPRVLLVPLAALAFSAFPVAALGAANHPFLQAIGGGFPVKPGYEDACGVARNGGLYISDYYHNTVILPSGQISPESAGSGPCKIELDAAGDLYVNNWHENVVKYSESELLAGHGAVIDAANPTGLWVEQSSGDLYVSHRTDLAKYGPTGNLLQTIGSGQLEEAYGVTVSEFPATAGDIYVPDAATDTIKVFNSAGTLIAELDGANTPQGRFTYLRDAEVAIDNSPTSPSYGHLFVLDAIGHGLSERPAAVLDEFNAQSAFRGQVSGFTDAEPSGVALDPISHNLYLTSGNSEGSQVFEYGPTSAAKTLTVVKEGLGGGTVASSPKAVACGSYCTAEYNEGQVVTLFANPDGHSAFTGWSVSGSEPCPSSGSCTVTMADDVEVKATFVEPTQQNLTVSTSGEGSVTSSPEGISCPGSCSEHFNQGRVVTLTAHPDAHWELVGWSGCIVQPNAGECKVTMASTQAVAVEFVPVPQLSLDLIESGTGQGTVTSYLPGISCPGTCSASFDRDSIVYLLAAPASSSSFAGFSGAGCSGTATICAVEMSQARSVSAEFRQGSQGASSAGTHALNAPLSIERIAVRGSTATLKLAVPEAGTVFAAGGGLKRVQAQVRAGAATLQLSLNERARWALARAKHRRLKVEFTLAFVSENRGVVDAVTRTIKFTQRSGRTKGQLQPRRL